MGAVATTVIVYVTVVSTTAGFGDASIDVVVPVGGSAAAGAGRDGEHRRGARARHV